MRRTMLILLATAVAAAGCDNQLPTGPGADDPAAALTTLSAMTPATAITTAMCMRGGWQELGFKNQGQCVSYVQTGKARMGFETTWDTRLGEGTTVILGLGGEVDATIYWGDGTLSRVTTPGPHGHDYGKEGAYTVSVTGSVTVFQNVLPYGGGTFAEIFANMPKLVSVDSWGDLGFTNMYFAFFNAANLVAVPRTTTGLENVVNMAAMFFGATSFNGDISRWDVSKVTNMGAMFQRAPFNQDIGGWDVSNVTDMSVMFQLTPFNRDISRWDVANVANMSRMFSLSSFNQDIGGWDVSNVENMSGMFWLASDFDQDIGGWDVSNVRLFTYMFEGATSFNQDIGGWDVSNVLPIWWGTVTGMDTMFKNAEAFNQDLSGWCVAPIPSKPAGFDDGAISWTDPRPVWGTCP
jgi:surface protein